MAENAQPDLGAGFLAFPAYPALPRAPASPGACLETSRLVRARPRSSPSPPPLGVGLLAVLPTLEASYLGGPP